MAGVDILIRDVTLRDGLQDERPIDTEAKLALYQALVAAGIVDLELTSFVRPDRVPALADADRFAIDTAAETGPTRWGLVLNRRGAERALHTGLSNLQFVFSVSERHNLENTGHTVAQSLVELNEVVTAARSHCASVEVTLATAFGCPFRGPIEPDEVLECVDAVMSLGVSGIGLADTIGTGAPNEVGRLARATIERCAGVPVGVHLHDTRGLAFANAVAALEAGAVRLDASVGGLGGCPFAAGASGNVATEDLVHGLESMGVRTGIDVEAIIEAARLACELVGRPLRSHVGMAGPRFAGVNR